jgi:PAS domain S-box-containing protein
MADTPAAFRSRLGSEHGESLFESLADVQFWMKDRAGRYMRVNRALVQNYGFADAAAVIGQSDEDLFPPHLAAQFIRDDQEALAGSPVRDRIELVGHGDRSTTWHVTNKLPLRDRQGRIIGTAGITRELDATSQVGLSASILQPVVAYLRAHVEAPLSKPRLAALIGKSVRSLERRFAEVLGTSPLAYHRTLRLQRACQLLLASDAAITGIGLDLGYADHSHFTRDFSRAYGMSPRAYRRRWSRQPRL